MRLCVVLAVTVSLCCSFPSKPAHLQKKVCNARPEDCCGHVPGCAIADALLGLEDHQDSNMLVLHDQHSPPPQQQVQAKHLLIVLLACRGCCTCLRVPMQHEQEHMSS